MSDTQQYAAGWYARYMKGETYAEIALSHDEEITRSAIGGAIHRYRIKHNLPGRAPQKVRPDTGTVIKESDRIKKKYRPQKLVLTTRHDSYAAQVSDPASCRMIAGDLQDGSAQFCSRPRLAGRSWCKQCLAHVLQKNPRMFNGDHETAVVSKKESGPRAPTLEDIA